MKRSSTFALIFCALSTSTLLAAAPGGGAGNPRGFGAGGPRTGSGAGNPQAGQNPQQAPISLKGTIANFNLTPRGTADGFILTTKDQSVQLNFPPELYDTLSKAVAIGDTVEVTAGPDNGPMGQNFPGGGNGAGNGQQNRRMGGMGMGGGPGGGAGGGGGGAGGGGFGGGGGGGGGGAGGGGFAGGGPDGGGGGPQGMNGPPQFQSDHPVYRLISLRDAAGKTYGATDPSNLQVAHVQSTVKAINYDRRGAPNGVQLATGDFVRIPPRQAQEAALTVGAAVTAGGPAETMPNGHLSIQAQQLNGNPIAMGPGGPGGGPGGDMQGPPGGPGGPGGFGGPGGPGGAQMP